MRMHVALCSAADVSDISCSAARISSAQIIEKLYKAMFTLISDTTIQNMQRSLHSFFCMESANVCCKY